MTTNYYQFIACCNGVENLFFSGDPEAIPTGTYEYQGKCYSVSYIFKTYPETLSPVPTSELVATDGCSSNECLCCQCIRVRSRSPLDVPLSIPAIDCNGLTIGILVPINKVWSEKQCISSWDIDLKIFEVEIFGDCESNGLPVASCSQHHVTIPIGSPIGQITYTDCTGIPQVINYPLVLPITETLVFEFCALNSVDVVTSGIDIITGSCSTPNYTCLPTTCFLLEDCEGIEEDIYATYASMSVYIESGAILKIDGFPNTCWTYREVETCECAIEITVLSTWVDCVDCQRCKGYKLTNCEDPTFIKYTTNDLSEHIGKTVEFENCPGCWSVECMEVLPPNDQNLIVDYSFENCTECLSTFWKLTPCIGDRDPIFTDNDLTTYVGFVLTLDGINDTCWNIEEVRDLEGSTFETIFINSYYTTCEECLVDILDCQCSSAVNSWPTQIALQYLNCNGEWINTNPILPGARTPKLCVVQWSEINNIVSEIEWYGNCAESLPVDATELSTWNCPVIVPKLRSVTPGYNTPGCPADYFEKVSCKFAEALYKNVLVDRYGITTNCSSTESNKWEIKKELLNLAAITNPDYDCPPILLCNNACVVTAAFENCLTGSCHSYTITYTPNAPNDTITYTDCLTFEETTIDHSQAIIATVYNICIKPGTPVITEGFLKHTGDCNGSIPILECLQYSITLSEGTPAGSYTYTDCAGVPQTVNYPNQVIGTIEILCAKENSVVTVGVLVEIGPCP